MPARISYRKLLSENGAKFIIINGIHTRHENAEKKNIILKLFSPFLPRSLTKVYARPADIPPTAPITAGKTGYPPIDGFMIKRLPINAAATPRI